MWRHCPHIHIRIVFAVLAEMVDGNEHGRRLLLYRLQNTQTELARPLFRTGKCRGGLDQGLFLQLHSLCDTVIAQFDGSNWRLGTRSQSLRMLWPHSSCRLLSVCSHLHHHA